MKVKICGITNIEDARISYQLGADAIGFIFHKKSKRFIEPERVEEIIISLPPLILKVGVFVNMPPNEINEISKKIKLNIVQLHGEENQDIIDKVDLPVIKALRIKNEFDYTAISQYRNCSILLDAFDDREYGGTGKQFNWDAIPVALRSKIILAGGVSVQNIKQIYNEINPYAVDISSSVEASPGIKDHEKLKELFNKIKMIKGA
jgi:phosphoribosylanthranilate isomerase